jgi:glucose/arabinose dehydrogenase
LHFWRPDGSEVSATIDPQPPGAPPTAPAGEASHVLAQHQASIGITITDDRRLPQWMNDPFHLGDIIEALLSRRDAARRRTHPTGSVTHGSVTIHLDNHDAIQDAEISRSRKNSNT